MGTKAASRWVVVVVLWLALLCCPAATSAQDKVGDGATNLTQVVKEGEKSADGTELLAGSVLALAALLLTALALVARPRRSSFERANAVEAPDTREFHGPPDS